jgi:hypothetical protein
MRREGLFDRLVERLPLRLNEAGLIDPGLFCIDGTNVRASRAAAGAGEKTGPPANPLTTPGAEAKAASARRSTWSPTATACPWRSW